MGIDHELASTPGLVVGFAASFASGTIDNRDGRGTVDVKTSGIGIYGSYTTETGMFLDGSFAFASSKNEATTAIIAGGSKTADFDTRTIQVGVRLGTIYETGTMTITPSIGVRYIKLNQDGFTERATGGAIAMTYDSLSDNIIDIPLEVRIQGQFQVGANLLTPELRLGWTYAAQNSDSAFSAGFAGTSQRTMFYGVEPSRSSFHAGAGLKVETQGPMDFFANYDLTTNSDFLDHKFSAGLGYQF